MLCVVLGKKKVGTYLIELPAGSGPRTRLDGLVEHAEVLRVVGEVLKATCGGLVQERIGMFPTHGGKYGALFVPSQLFEGNNDVASVLVEVVSERGEIAFAQPVCRATGDADLHRLPLVKLGNDGINGGRISAASTFLVQRIDEEGKTGIDACRVKKTPRLVGADLHLRGEVAAQVTLACARIAEQDDIWAIKKGRKWPWLRFFL